MKQLKLRDAKAKLSEVVEDALRGEPTTITRYGRPAAVVVPVAAFRQVGSSSDPTLAELVLGLPVGLDDVIERDQTPIRDF
jgi:prevent-host-death family protein